MFNQFAYQKRDEADQKTKSMMYSSIVNLHVAEENHKNLVSSSCYMYSLV